MNPLPAQSVLGITEAARFDHTVREMISVSINDFLKEEAKEVKAKNRKIKP